MPKCYSEQEREQIRNRLREEAARCLALYGIRKTTVDELVKCAGIPKGTFYLFYPSKEALLFEVILGVHDRIDHEVYQAICHLKRDENLLEQMTDLLYHFFKLSSEEPMLKLLNSGELALLLEKLPPETIAAHLENDTDTTEKMLKLLPIKSDINLNVVSAVLHEIYFATLHREQIDADGYDEGLRLLIRGVLLQVLA